MRDNKPIDRSEAKSDNEMKGSSCNCVFICTHELSLGRHLNKRLKVLESVVVRSCMNVCSCEKRAVDGQSIKKKKKKDGVSSDESALKRAT